MSACERIVAYAAPATPRPRPLTPNFGTTSKMKIGSRMMFTIIETPLTSVMLFVDPSAFIID